MRARKPVFDGLDVYQDFLMEMANPDVPVDACNPDNTEPYAFNDQDCNDGEATIYFDAPGTGENVDNNCDGAITGAEVIIVEGCTDSTACNYNAEAMLDDATCEFAQEGFDCEGNCVVGEDCEGTSGGGSVGD